MYDGSMFEDVLSSVIAAADKKVMRCSNCKMKRFLCRTRPYVTKTKFVLGAEVEVTEDLNDERLLVHYFGLF